MTEVVEFIDWGDDFRYAEERQRVTEIVRDIATVRRFTRGVVQWVHCFLHEAPPLLLNNLKVNVDKKSLPSYGWIAINSPPEED